MEYPTINKITIEKIIATTTGRTSRIKTGKSVMEGMTPSNIMIRSSK